METLAHAVQQKAQKTIEEYQSNTRDMLEKSRQWFSTSISNITDTVRLYISKYPPVAAFLFILIVLSSIPISIFTIFVISTAVCTLSVALVGFSIVEGTFLVTGGGILLFVLAGVSVCTVLGFLWGYGMYLTYCASCKAFSACRRGASAVSGKVSETAQSLVTAGMPPPSSGSEHAYGSKSTSPFPGTARPNF